MNQAMDSWLDRQETNETSGAQPLSNSTSAAKSTSTHGQAGTETNVDGEHEVDRSMEGKSAVLRAARMREKRDRATKMSRTDLESEYGSALERANDAEVKLIAAEEKYDALRISYEMAQKQLGNK